ncbi:apoptotic chromatin condensation inducer 1b isoform X3 [Scophthalmus maximus]|uniref:apoptotic chromatin condensation inducer 1b isoform X3 n=1 Tax=Scophthalmus maximus TaxID=52904 RepID=UPI001FA911A5|nr:apoptotic chromatin condensation inducer 1b isoform X3 [Scophthalmus maximus]
MADEDITLDGKPLQSLRVADLKAALEQRNLPKSGQKNTLVKRLKGALMLENLQKSSSSHSGLQPNSQIGEEMCQNSFIKQYLAKQQELLRQRLEREAQQEEEADESPAVQEEDEDHSDNDCYVSDKGPIPSQSALTRTEERGGGAASAVGHGMMMYSHDVGPSHTFRCQESPETPGARMQRAMGNNEPPAPSPPRAVASLSVRVLGKPDRQGLPPAVPRAQEKEGTAPSEPGSAHAVLHLSRSAGASAASNVNMDSDDDDGDDERDNDEDWGPGPGKARQANRVPPQPQQMPPSAPSAGARSKRKLQPPQHIPPPQVHHTPMQLRHPTPPPSPPPDLFPLPDTPKQSPPDPENQEGGGPEAALGPRGGSFPSATMKRQDSDSSSRSSSPEPPAKCRPGPLSLLLHKMESEGGFRASSEMSEEAAHSSAGSSRESPLQKLERKRQQENREMEEERQLKKEQERERGKAQEKEREKKRLEEEKEKERKRLDEEEKLCRAEERENEQKRQEEEKEKERKRQDEEKKKREEKRIREEQEKRQQTTKKGRVVVTEAQDSGSSSDSDSKSDSSSCSSQSSSSSRDKSYPAQQPKKVGQEAEEEKKTDPSNVAKKRHLSKREVSEPSAAAVTEVEPDAESSMADQPASGAEPESTENRLEESTTPKAFAARKISLTSSKTPSAAADGGGAGEPESGTAAGRKRRWGSSTAVTVKKPSISITTDSLKSLIPDIKINQEAVVELHPEELQLSGDEENVDNSLGDQDKGLKIRRTVTQVVPGDSQENGQTNEEEEAEKMETEKPRRTSRDNRKNSLSEEAVETQISVKLEGEAKKVTPSDSLVRRSISQQKSGVSVTIDDPVRTARQPSPPRGKITNIVHLTNLVRPFTLGQLKELLNRTGTLVEDGFWIDKIKSHCFVTYATSEEAVATRAAIHGIKWPSSNPKVLSVDFCEQDELDFHKGVLKPVKEDEHVVQPSAPPQTRLPPLMPERDRDRDRERERERDRGVAGVPGVRDLWAEREREMERRERARGEREWDRDKVREFARPGEEGRRSRSRDRERKRRERAKSKERKTDKKEKGDEPPAKLLDDLFLKTKSAPCIYWLPLTEEQATQRLLDRTERREERERRRKEQQEDEEKKREEEKKERLKVREKDGVAAASGGVAAGRGPDGDRERGRGRDREREREGDKRRDSGHRPRRTSAGAGSGRRSRSRSNPRERRR